MNIKNRSYEELQEIAKFYSIFIPAGIDRKNLEKLLYKNINLKTLNFKLVLLFDIVVENGENILKYIDSIMPAFPEIFLGKLLYKDDCAFLFERFGIARISNRILRIDLTKGIPFSDEDILQVENHFRNIERRIEVNNFFNPDEETKEFYNLEENVNLKYTYTDK